MKNQTKPGQQIVVKIQSVRIIPLTVDVATNPTIGQQVDHLLNAEYVNGVLPNKLVIDLNPPRDDQRDMD